MQPKQVYRTGRIAYLRREKFTEIFNLSIDPKVPLAFVEPSVINRLLALAQKD